MNIGMNAITVNMRFIKTIIMSLHGHIILKSDVISIAWIAVMNYIMSRIRLVHMFRLLLLVLLVVRGHIIAVKVADIVTQKRLKQADIRETAYGFTIATVRLPQ